MSSSTFAVSSTSESDLERELELELDDCDENGIMSTTLDGELPKDHNYTKEPDFADELREIMDPSDQLSEMINTVSPLNSRPSRTSRIAQVKRATAPKAQPKVKPGPASRKLALMKKIQAQSAAPEETAAPNEAVTANGDPEEATSNAETVKPSKPAKRASKRKAEVKEAEVEPEKAEESTDVEPEKEASPAKKQNTRTKKLKAAPKSPKKRVFPEDTIETNNLPKGWVRKTVVRKSGKTAGQSDIYYYSPDGSKFRSKPDVAAYLMRTKSNIKLEIFDFGKKPITLNAPATPQKKTPPSTAKTSPKKKAATPKKLLVKIVKEKKTPAKGKKDAKGAKKK